MTASFSIGNMGSDSLYLYGFVAIAVVIVALYILRYSKFGRSVYAIGGSEQSARLMGKDREDTTPDHLPHRLIGRRPGKHFGDLRSEGVGLLVAEVEEYDATEEQGNAQGRAGIHRCHPREEETGRSIRFKRSIERRCLKRKNVP